MRKLHCVAVPIGLNKKGGRRFAPDRTRRSSFPDRGREALRSCQQPAGEPGNGVEVLHRRWSYASFDGLADPVAGAARRTVGDHEVFRGRDGLTLQRFSNYDHDYREKLEESKWKLIKGEQVSLRLFFARGAGSGAGS